MGGGERLANKGLWGNGTFNDLIESDFTGNAQ